MGMSPRAERQMSINLSSSKTLMRSNIPMYLSTAIQSSFEDGPLLHSAHSPLRSQIVVNYIVVLEQHFIKTQEKIVTGNPLGHM
jgi:hypothetical protein